MFCEECGSQVEDGSLFCPNCGFRFGNDEMEVTESVRPEEPVAPIQSEEQTITAEPVPIPVEDDEKTLYISREEQQKAEEIVRDSQKNVQSQSGNMVFCSNCGAMNSESEAFCSNCGSPLHEQEPAGVKPTPKNKGLGGILAKRKQKAQSTRKIKLPMLIGIGAAAVVVLAVIIGTFFFLRGGSGSERSVYYIKDREFYKADVKSLEPMTLDDDWGDNADSSYRALYMRESENGKYVFYLRYNHDDSALYCIDQTDKEPEPQKIDSNLSSSDYCLLSDNRVVYEKNDSLYVNNLEEEKEKITSDISWYSISDDEKTIVWTTRDGGLYKQDLSLKEEKEKLDSEVAYVNAVSDDCSMVVYGKEDALYLNNAKGEKEKIASDISYVIGTAFGKDSAKVYYFEQADASESSLSDFITDDLKDDDDDIEEPDKNDYIESKGLFGYIYSDEYFRLLDEYKQKLKRNELRQQLKDLTISIDTGSVEYYDSASGEKTTVFDGAFDHALYGNSFDGNLVAVCAVKSLEDVPTIKFSDVINNISSAYDRIDDSLRENAKTILLYNETQTDLFDADKRIANQYILDEKNNKLFMIVKEDADLELGEVSLEEKTLGEYNTAMNDVQGICGFLDNELIYQKEYDSRHNTCDLYVGEEKVDSDVDVSRITQTNDGKILYFKDYSDDKGTLKIYDGKEAVKVADDANAFNYCLKSERVAVLVDYSRKSEQGDLKIFDGSDLEKLDMDVSKLSPVLKRTRNEVRDYSHIGSDPVEYPQAAPAAEPAVDAEEADW